MIKSESNARGRRKPKDSAKVKAFARMSNMNAGGASMALSSVQVKLFLMSCTVSRPSRTSVSLVTTCEPRVDKAKTAAVSASNAVESVPGKCVKVATESSVNFFSSLPFNPLIFETETYLRPASPSNVFFTSCVDSERNPSAEMDLARLTAGEYFYFFA